jgi:hypothetical protein
MKGLTGVSQKDKVTVIGALSKSLIKELLKDILSMQQIETYNLPDGVRISQRGGNKILFNFNQKEIQWRELTYPSVSFTKI